MSPRLRKIIKVAKYEFDSYLFWLCHLFWLHARKTESALILLIELTLKDDMYMQRGTIVLIIDIKVVFGESEFTFESDSYLSMISV